MRLLLINPNTRIQTTALMTDIANEALDESRNQRMQPPPNARVEGLTVKQGVPLITDEPALTEAAKALIDLIGATDLSHYRGIIIAAFGDPGLGEVRARVEIPVTGIAEAAMAEAPGRFAVVTTTPLLATSIERSARLYGHAERFAGVHLTPGDPASLMASPSALLEAMLEACQRAIRAVAPDSIVIGGGPLARVARELRQRLPLPVIEPIPAATRLALVRALS